MRNFKTLLHKEISKFQWNNYGPENFDEYRFGPYPYGINNTLSKGKRFANSKRQIKNSIKSLTKSHKEFNIQLADNYIGDRYHKIDAFWKNLSVKDKKLYVKLFAYRILGFKKVKLPLNNQYYWKALEVAKKLGDGNCTYNPNFLHFILKKFNLGSIGYDIEFFFTEKGVATDFIFEQYAYQSVGNRLVSVFEGDTVLDLGGCWGDTALYFAHKIGENGMVYSFEFIPENLKIMEMNISMNPRLKNRIEILKKPVTEKSGKKVFFKGNGPGSKVSFEPFEGLTGECDTISIDDFVKEKDLQKVDFIKMDIEGAEPLALEGAVNTIKFFRPKLAIAIYHNIDDMVNIPLWILNLGLDYEVFIGHFTIHAEETICFARPKKRK